MARYVPSLVPSGDSLPQLQRWLREENEQTRNSTDDIYTLAGNVLLHYTAAGYGGIGLDAVTPLANIGATWQQLPFDVLLITDPKAVSYDLLGNGIILNSVGVWRFNAKVSLEFLELNAGRRIQLTLWDINAAQAVGPIFNFSVGRNTDGVNLTFNVLFDVTTFVDQPLGLAVNSATDSFSGVSAIGSIFDINHVSEFKGDLVIEGLRKKQRV